MRFSGGTSVDKKGYLTCKAGPQRDVRVHILVAEAMLGRELLPGEEVNHKDGNKLNPKWTNLEILNKGEHAIVSNRQRWFLKNRALHERKQWEEWINTGNNKPPMEDELVPFDNQF